MLVMALDDYLNKEKLHASLDELITPEEKVLLHTKAVIFTYNQGIESGLNRGRPNCDFDLKISDEERRAAHERALPHMYEIGYEVGEEILNRYKLEEGKEVSKKKCTSLVCDVENIVINIMLYFNPYFEVDAYRKSNREGPGSNSWLRKEN